MFLTWHLLTNCVGILDRYYQNAPIPWSAITTSSGIFVICVLVGYILYAASIHIAKVEQDFQKMQELKVQAEAADVAKSQVLKLSPKQFLLL